MTREEALIRVEGYLTSYLTLEDSGEIDEIMKALEQEPTAKNDVGVDCIDRDSAIKALDYDIKCFEFKSGVSKHMDDIAKLLNTIYETQVNNIKALPSVTPQEPRWILDSERLPESSGNYLITYCYQNKIETQEAVYSEDEDEAKWFDITGVEITLAVIAWMPLPKPYEPQESEDNNGM